MASTNKLRWQSFLTPEPDPLPLPRVVSKIRSYGPEELRLRENVVSTESPEYFVLTHPHLFKTGNTSRDEGYFYWALLKIIGPERQRGNYNMIWFYQSKVSGGANQIGGSIVDFVIQKSGRGKDLGIRIVTPFRHTGAGPFVKAKDLEQSFRLSEQGIEVIDVLSKNYLNDKTGRDVILAARRAIESRPDRSPLSRHFGVS